MSTRDAGIPVAATGETNSRETVFREIGGGCHCGAVRYAITGRPRRHSLCFCSDCRRCAGAPAVGWTTVEDSDLRVTGEVAVYHSSPGVERSFCPKCGAGLFYRCEAMFPGCVDVQSGTFDDPEILPPTELIQVAEAPSWVEGIKSLPKHLRWPPEALKGTT